MPETPHDPERTEVPRAPQPVVVTTPTAGLQTLDLGPDSAIGMVCDIDDPDCVPGMVLGAPSMTGDDEG